MAAARNHTEKPIWGEEEISEKTTPRAKAQRTQSSEKTAHFFSLRAWRLGAKILHEFFPSKF
jgi:hypothetical protein